RLAGFSPRRLLDHERAHADARHLVPGRELAPHVRHRPRVIDRERMVSRDPIPFVLGPVTRVPLSEPADLTGCRGKHVEQPRPERLPVVEPLKKSLATLRAVELAA